MPNRSTPRTARRPEAQPAGSDVAVIFERRLLARGIRTDDFLSWRGSTDLPPIPAITPVRFGRGVTESAIAPLAVASPAVETAPEPAAETASETDPPDDPDAN